MQKQEEIINMFNQIAPSYDVANRVLSFGVDISWRKYACEYVLKSKNENLSIVDVACGTGDMIDIWQKSAKKIGAKIANIEGIDASEKMLEVAKKKYSEIKFSQALAQSLPLQNESVDIISISYGIRNVTERSKALSEFVRVLKSGGVLLVLEFTKREKGGVLARIRDFYLQKILPKIGGFISKNQAAYEYLPSSIDDFLSKDEFIKELENAGLKMIKYKSFSFGISSMFVAQK